MATEHRRRGFERHPNGASAALIFNSAVMAALLLLTPGHAFGATRTARSGTSDVLRVLTHEQVRKAGAAGTGCSWSLANDHRTRFAAADDHAVVRVAKGIVALRPAIGAHDLFPFTYDRWKGEGIVLRVLPHGTASRNGSETLEQSAAIEIRMGGMRRIERGRLICGS